MKCYFLPTSEMFGHSEMFGTCMVLVVHARQNLEIKVYAKDFLIEPIIFLFS